MQRVFVHALLAVSAAICTTSWGGEAIHLKPVNGILTVPVLINDRITLDFMLDSG